MNRRNVLFALLASLFGGLFIGWRKYGTASPKAVALAHNGIISKDRTPHLIGCKVYVNGKRIEHAISVNTTKGYVLAWNQKPTADPMSWTKSRIYGYIDIDPSDCFIARPRLCSDNPHSVDGRKPVRYGDSIYWVNEDCKCGKVACAECRPRYIQQNPDECKHDLERLQARTT